MIVNGMGFYMMKRDSERNEDKVGIKL